MFDYINNTTCCEELGEDVAKVCVKACEPQVRADIVMHEQTPVRIWGQLSNQCGDPIAGVLLTLVKVCEDRCGRRRCRPIAQTVSDSCGMYSFEVCSEGVPVCYHVMARRDYACNQSSCGGIY